jgi:hypothetical protein
LSGGAWTDSFTTEFGSNGDVCSCEEITLHGNKTTIKGDAFHGHGFALETSGGASVTGTIGAIARCLQAMVDLTEASENNDNASIGRTDKGRSPFSSGLDLKLSDHDNLTLAPGTYYFTSVELSGPATLTVTGKTDIHVQGKVKLTGGSVVNVGKTAADLKIIVAGDEVSVSGESACYATILAPQATLKITGQGELYGAALGRLIDLSGKGRIHVVPSLPGF